MSAELLRTPFHDWHEQHGGRMVDFAGWQMPVQYGSIVDEHHAVRQHVGLFDIAHMGRLWFKGDGAPGFLDGLLTVDVAAIADGHIRYSLVTNENGGILDDVLVYRLGEEYLVVVNASNREKLVAWFQQHLAGSDVVFTDRTFEQAMLAIQGPWAMEVMQLLLGPGIVEPLPYYQSQRVTLAEVELLISRTGYTGEDGFEVIVAAESALPLWEQLVELGQGFQLQPAGLGCRDTLRLEAAMPLYGHELSESIDPLSAGLGFAVAKNNVDYVGKAAIEKIRSVGPPQKRIGLILEGRRIAREGSEVLLNSNVVGEVTSGTFSPTLQQSVCMATVKTEAASQQDGDWTVAIRGSSIPATRTPLPFYRRPKSTES